MQKERVPFRQIGTVPAEILGGMKHLALKESVSWHASGCGKISGSLCGSIHITNFAKAVIREAIHQDIVSIIYSLDKSRGQALTLPACKGVHTLTVLSGTISIAAYDRTGNTGNHVIKAVGGEILCIDSRTYDIGMLTRNVSENFIAVLTNVTNVENFLASRMGYIANDFLF